jgi:hypothetical protein
MSSEAHREYFLTLPLECRPSSFLAVRSPDSCLWTVMKCLTRPQQNSNEKAPEVQNCPKKRYKSKMLLVKWIEKKIIDNHELIALGPQQQEMKGKPYETLLLRPASNWTQQLETQQKLRAHGSRTKLTISQQICKEENTYQCSTETSPEKYYRKAWVLASNISVWHGRHDIRLNGIVLSLNDRF